MFNIIKTPRNYFTRELLHDSYCGISLQRKSLAAILGGKLFGGSVLPAQYCPCGHGQVSVLFLVRVLFGHFARCDKRKIPVPVST